MPSLVFHFFPFPLSLFCGFPLCSLLFFSLYFSFPHFFSTFLVFSSSGTQGGSHGNKAGLEGGQFRRSSHPGRQMRHFQGQVPYLLQYWHISLPFTMDKTVLPFLLCCYLFCVSLTKLLSVYSNPSPVAFSAWFCTVRWVLGTRVRYSRTDSIYLSMIYWAFTRFSKEHIIIQKSLRTTGLQEFCPTDVNHICKLTFLNTEK